MSKSIQYVKGVGPAKMIILARLGIRTIEDLLNFFPRRYEDRRQVTPIMQLKEGEAQTISGRILIKGQGRSWYTRKAMTQVTVDDGSGRLRCVWFNQPYLANYFKSGKHIVCHGKVERYKGNVQMVSPEYEIIEGEEDAQLSLKRIVPVYALTRGMTQRFLRKLVRYVLDHHLEELSDELPEGLRRQHGLLPVKKSVEEMHFPTEFDKQQEALRRISFEEFFFFQLSIILRRLSLTHQQGHVQIISDAAALTFVQGLSFDLTGAQRQVIREIRADMKKSTPMLRLVQGDVGCGKTLVALFACWIAFQNQRQSCMMAPTEILARQHYKNIQALVAQGVLPKMRVVLLVSGLKKKERDAHLAAIEAGAVDLVVGTHALIGAQVQFKSLGLAVIDEQHKFGVHQRALLTEKGSGVDVLIMTATPIPRTLCITLYGDMDVSIIDEMPPGRGKVRTKNFKQGEVDWVYQFVNKQVDEGRQAYVVYPLVEESEVLDLKAAQEMHKHFIKNEFKDRRVALVHGQMKQADTQDVMDQFKAGELDILVATTVLEVGVDVANATVMVIEHAERFGLAQLHQLRGRIGRGKADAYCMLVGEPKTEEGQKRLAAIVATTDGFEIARQDLMIRGPGHFFGRQQHGFSELRVADPITQMDILELARREAMNLMKADPALEHPVHEMIKTVIQRRYPTYLAMIAAG